MEVEIVCCQINVSVIERGVRYIVGGLCKVGIFRLIELSTTLKYLYFWTRDCIRFSIYISRLVLTSDGVVVGVVVRSAELII